MTTIPPRVARSRSCRWIPAVILSLSLVAPAAADAKRVFVPRQHKKLQAAIDAASPGDTIWVAPGTYQGPFLLKKRLVLFGEGGPKETILDGGDSARVLHVEGVGRGAGIYGFRIQRGRAPGGGGIYCLRDSGFAIGSCEIRSNWEAGLAAWQCAPIQIADSEIMENKGSGFAASDSKVQLVHVDFRRNEGVGGGGLALVNSELLIARDCTFDGNRATGGTGGGLSATASAARIMNCVFQNNTSAVAGGAIAADDSSDVRVRQTKFTANRGATAGAVLADRSSIGIESCIFDRNRATAAGSAVQILGRRVHGVNPLLFGNTFYRNGADSEGAAIFLQEVSPDIRRNIFVIDSTAKNKAVLELKGTPRYECNLVHALDGRAVAPSANTIVGDPMFCDPEKGDFHVRDLSPAVLAACGRMGALGKGCASFRMIPSQ